ncbi:DUF5388 domain-containing protein [Lactiplantibacillus plantarum]|uniref:DUF5388 domain-containing protein n=1 Tax=Lactiplantibacillus plantarum TaxID=1590 RepID=UPI001BA60265|nr:DUF5388 domain-containing protein [Lactiplantibacillus plantarum]MBS0953558.1 DUF5388 domain-containing protein [Lactiplantibacillus plantarum]
MANSLIRSNRNKNNVIPKPAKQAKASDFDTNAGDNKTVSSVTFDTNLKISNHTRNKLQAMAMIGYAENQRLSVDTAIQSFYEQLSTNEQREFDLQVSTLESRDIKLKSKK